MDNKQDSVAVLLACPFCGKSDLDQWPNEWLDGSGANVIRCAWCHGAAPAKTWNRRALQSQQEIQIVPDSLEDFRSRLIDLFYRHAQLGIEDDASLADKVIEQLEYAALATASREAQREAVDLMRSILARGQWHEAWRGTKHMQLKLSYEYEAWERIMKQIETPAVSAASTVGGYVLYGFIRECDGRVQISIGPERPHDRSSGVSTPWVAIYARSAGEGNGNG